MSNAIQVPPPDEYNQTLVANVHPPEWVNPQPGSRYNLVVIGAGTAGLVTAAGAAALGARVAIIEKHLMGGDCLNFGCVPSKALIRAARAAAAVRKAGEFGVRVPDPVRVDFAAVMQRMRRLRAAISRNDSAARFRDLGVDVYLGEPRFNGSDTLQIGSRVLRFKRAVIATGSRAATLPIPGLAQAGYLTNETVFSLTELPKRLAVIGGGPIGCELSQAFARFGANVSLFEVEGQILLREDPDAAKLVESALLDDGVTLLTGAKVLEVRTGPDGKTIFYEREGRRLQVIVDEILLGVGRTPNVEGMNLEGMGVQLDKKTGVKVDDRLRTTNPHIYACGDVCFPYKFTHTADFTARIVIANALFPSRAKASALIVPWCTYTDPEIAQVGLTENEAKERGIAVTTLVQQFSDVDRAVLDGEERGFVKIHLKKRTDKILGATIVANHAGDMISEITLAMTADAAVPGWKKRLCCARGVGLSTIGKTIHPYPTQAEAIRKLADQYNRTRLTPLVTWLLKKWLGWKR
ncbi:MAG: mercuric reductase [Planctomycetaceae bacterium]